MLATGEGRFSGAVTAVLIQNLSVPIAPAYALTQDNSSNVIFVLSGTVSSLLVLQPLSPDLFRASFKVVASGNGSGEGMFHDTVTRIISHQAVMGEGLFHAGPGYVANQPGIGEGGFHSSKTVIAGARLGGEGRFSSSGKAVGSEKSYGTGHFASMVHANANGVKSGTGRFSSSVYVTNVHPSTITATCGFRAGITVYSFVGGAQIMTFAEQEMGGTMSVGYRVDPNHWLWNFIYQ